MDPRLDAFEAPFACAPVAAEPVSLAVRSVLALVDVMFPLATFPPSIAFWPSFALA
jgi:hypothetical protein